jgi:hypothetical protein
VNFFAGNSKIWRPNAEILDVKAGIFVFKSAICDVQDDCEVSRGIARGSYS